MQAAHFLAMPQRLCQLVDRSMMDIAGFSRLEELIQTMTHHPHSYLIHKLPKHVHWMIIDALVANEEAAYAQPPEARVLQPLVRSSMSDRSLPSCAGSKLQSDAADTTMGSPSGSGSHASSNSIGGAAAAGTTATSMRSESHMTPSPCSTPASAPASSLSSHRLQEAPARAQAVASCCQLLPAISRGSGKEAAPTRPIGKDLAEGGNGGQRAEPNCCGLWDHDALMAADSWRAEAWLFLPTPQTPKLASSPDFMAVVAPIPRSAASASIPMAAAMLPVQGACGSRGRGELTTAAMGQTASACLSEAALWAVTMRTVAEVGEACDWLSKPCSHWQLNCAIQELTAS